MIPLQDVPRISHWRVFNEVLPGITLDNAATSPVGLYTPSCLHVNTRVEVHCCRKGMHNKKKKKKKVRKVRLRLLLEGWINRTWNGFGR